MTIAELYKQVAALNFETSLENDEFFFITLRRALLEVSCDFPKIATGKVINYPLKNLAQSTEFSVFNNKMFVFLKAKAFYFECNSISDGQLKIEYLRSDGVWEILQLIELNSANRAFVSYKGFVKIGGIFQEKSVRFTFLGDCVFAVKNFCVYSDIVSQNADDIPPYAEIKRLDLSEIYPDILQVLSVPLRNTENGKFIYNGYFYSENSLSMSNELVGEYEFSYKKKADFPSDGQCYVTSNYILDISPEAEIFLANLMAYYLFLDDSQEKAEQYLQIYKTAHEQREKDFFENIATISSNGW